MSSPRISVTVIIFAAAFAVLLIFASLFPHPWLWGVNWWSGLGMVPMILGISVVILIAAISFVLLRWAERIDLTEGNDTVVRSRWKLIVLAAAILAPVLGWLFRAQSFVLGDGYAVIGNLQLAVPIIKARNFGGSLLPLLLYDILPGDAPTRAQLAYQFTSVGAGVLYVLAAAFACSVIFKKLSERLILFLLLLTSGNMLLYFGYAENYPLFHVVYLLACVFGYRFIRDEKLRDAVWFTALTLLALVTHIFAVSLIPAAIGALLPFVARQLKWKKILGPCLSAIVAVVVSFLGALSMYLVDNFARMSFLPIFPNEFTADAYTLFSLRHLADTLNLIIMLMPSLPILLFYRKFGSTSPERQFLLFVTLTGLGLAFWVNPWLGMPRDWDLLSFWMIPAILYLGGFIAKSEFKQVIWAIPAAVFLSTTLLTARVASNANELLMWQHVDRYAKHDPMRLLKFRIVHDAIMEQNGDKERARRIRQQVDLEFPEIKLIKESLVLLDAGRYQEAADLSRKVIATNKIISDPYANLGDAQVGLGQYDSARRNFDIAGAFNPYNPSMLNNYARLEYELGNYDKSLELLKKSLIYDSEDPVIRHNLFSLYVVLHDTIHAREQAEVLLLSRSLSPQQTLSTITGLARMGQNDLARRFIDDAVQRGMDTSSARMLIERYPGLR